MLNCFARVMFHCSSQLRVTDSDVLGALMRGDGVFELSASVDIAADTEVGPLPREVPCSAQRASRSLSTHLPLVETSLTSCVERTYAPRDCFGVSNEAFDAWNSERTNPSDASRLLWMRAIESGISLHTFDFSRSCCA